MRRQFAHLETPASDLFDQRRVPNPHWAQNIAEALEAAGAHTQTETQPSASRHGRTPLCVITDRSSHRNISTHFPESYGPQQLATIVPFAAAGAGIWDQIVGALAAVHNAAAQMINTSIVYRARASAWGLCRSQWRATGSVARRAYEQDSRCRGRQGPAFCNSASGPARRTTIGCVRFP